MYRWWHFLAESAARALPFPKSQRPTCPFSFTPGGTPPARPSVASALLGMSLFRRFRCYLGRPPALHGPLRHPPLPGVSRFRRIGSHLRRVTQAPRPGAMAAGAQEQAASCDAFVLSRRQPAPGAPPSRTSPLCLIAKPFPEPRRTTARSLAGTAAANSVRLGQGRPVQTAF